MGALDKVRGALKSALDQVEAAAPKLGPRLIKPNPLE